MGHTHVDSDRPAIQQHELEPRQVFDYRQRGLDK